MKLYIYNNSNYAEIEFLKNSNNKYKQMTSAKDINELKKVISYLFNVFIKDDSKLLLDNKLIEIDYVNKIKLLNLFYKVIYEEFSKEECERIISLIILETAVKSEMLKQEEVETRFFINKNEMYKVEQNNEFFVKIKEIELVTDLVKFLTKNNIIDISFNSNYIDELTLNVGEIVEISAIKSENVINKKIEILNFYYDEINQCYFISGKNVY